MSRAAAGSTLDSAVRTFTYPVISPGAVNGMLEHTLLHTLVRTELIESSSSSLQRWDTASWRASVLTTKREANQRAASDSCPPSRPFRSTFLRQDLAHDIRAAEIEQNTAPLVDNRSPYKRRVHLYPFCLPSAQSWYPVQADSRQRRAEQ